MTLVWSKFNDFINEDWLAGKISDHKVLAVSYGFRYFADDGSLRLGLIVTFSSFLLVGSGACRKSQMLCQYSEVLAVFIVGFH